MSTTLQIKDKAPLFTAKDQHGNSISLTDYIGKKVVMYFYPQDATPTCTVQACNLRDNFTELTDAGIVVIGISPDTTESHLKFTTKQQLPFVLLDDSSKTIIENYGVWGQKQMYGKAYLGLHRTTFLIDEEGVIQHIFLKPKSKEHSQEILKKVKDLFLEG